MKMNGKTLAETMLICLSCISFSLLAQEYPNKEVRVIFPAPPGGLDPILRTMNQKLTEQLGRQVLLENRGGGATIPGTNFVARATPDGYTILAQSDQIFMTSLLQKTSYDPIKDFDPIALLCYPTQALFIQSSIPANNLRGLIALAKARPGFYTNGVSGGTGSSPHVNSEMLKRAAGVDILNVYYQGGVNVATALLSGEVSMALVGPGVPIILAALKSGKIRAIAVLTGSGKRIAAMPDVPLFAEAGLPFESVDAWVAYFAPAGTPQEILRKLNAAINSAIKTPDVLEGFRVFGMAAPSRNNSVDELSAFMKSEFAVRQRTVKLTGLKPAE